MLLSAYPSICLVTSVLLAYQRLGAKLAESGVGHAERILAISIRSTCECRCSLADIVRVPYVDGINLYRPHYRCTTLAQWQPLHYTHHVLGLVKYDDSFPPTSRGAGQVFGTPNSLSPFRAEEVQLQAFLQTVDTSICHHQKSSAE